MAFRDIKNLLKQNPICQFDQDRWIATHLCQRSTSTLDKLGRSKFKISVKT